jgi:hypothetical protein
MLWTFTYQTHDMIVHINAIHQLQNSCSFNAKATSCNTIEINHFATTCDHGQITIDYQCIYFAYIRLYKVQFATNVQLNYNYEIL